MERLREEGEARGEIIGEERMRALIDYLISDGRADEIQNVINNVETCGKFYEKYELQRTVLCPERKLNKN